MERWLWYEALKKSGGRRRGGGRVSEREKGREEEGSHSRVSDISRFQDKMAATLV